MDKDGGLPRKQISHMKKFQRDKHQNQKREKLENVG